MVKVVRSENTTAQVTVVEHIYFQTPSDPAFYLDGSSSYGAISDEEPYQRTYKARSGSYLDGGWVENPGMLHVANLDISSTIFLVLPKGGKIEVPPSCSSRFFIRGYKPGDIRVSGKQTVRLTITVLPK